MQYYESNVLATENLFAAINEMGIRCRVLFVSTAGVYGNQATNVLNEELRPLPVSHYGLSKFVCERLASILGSAHDVTIARPFNVIGPGQNADFLVPKLIHHFAHRKPRILLGNLDPVRDYIDVAACCDALAGLLTKDEAIGETVNICSGQGSSVREMLSHLRELSGHDIEAVVSPDFVRKNEVWSLLGCARKLDSLLPNRYRGAPLRTILSAMLDEAVGAPNHNR